MLRNSGWECSGEEAREWTVLPKEEPSSGNSLAAQYAKEDEARFGDSTEHHQAGILATRSTAAGRPLSGTHGSCAFASLPDAGAAVYAEEEAQNTAEEEAV